MRLFFEILRTVLLIVIVCFLAYKIDSLTYRFDRMNGCLCQPLEKCEVL